MYLVLIILMGVYSTGDLIGNLISDDRGEIYRYWVGGVGLTIPVFIYFMQYYWGIQNYNTKRFMIGSLTVLYIMVLVAQYIIAHKEKDKSGCDWFISSKVFSDTGDVIYRFIYGAIMMAIPMILTKSHLIFLWALFAPILIPVFLYISSLIMGLGAKSGDKNIDATNYYTAFVRGIGTSENYTDSLGINLLRSIIRGIILICFFVIAFMVSKKIINPTDYKTTGYSVFIFLVLISSVLPIMLGYFIEPKCLLNETAENTDENDSDWKCIIFDKHGGIAMHVIYIFICAVILIWRDFP